jgi:formylglycine-generating enzyme required for sulfatase activity
VKHNNLLLLTTLLFASLMILCIEVIATNYDKNPNRKIPSKNEYNSNWPRFRGPDGNGIYFQSGTPISCDRQTGKNIIWKTEVPADGFGSPVVWGDKVFLSGGDSEKRMVMCFDATSGKILWENNLPKTNGSPAGSPDIPELAGMAAATVATDGSRVYAIFGNGDLAAYNFDGTLAWSKYLGFPQNSYGHATSLLTWEDRLIVQFDQGTPSDNLSKLYAFDGATGSVIWEKSRSVGASWATPITFDVAGKEQIITLSLPWVIAYSVKDGAEIWRAKCLQGEITPSPIIAGGRLYIVSPSDKVQSIFPDGTGDVTKTCMIWSSNNNVPDIVSPVSNNELLFLLSSGGTLTCNNIMERGRLDWTYEIGEECHASLSLAGNRLYIFSTKGKMIVLEAGGHKLLGSSDLGEKILASPAFSKNRIFVRGSRNLFCIGDKSNSTTENTTTKQTTISTEELTNPKDGEDMVLVPAGEFIMGNPDGVGSEGEHPQRKVFLDDYYIYKYEVTVAQYRKFCEATGRAMPEEPWWKWHDAHPIVNVTWFDASAYAAWAGASLPTEAQWEKVARGTDDRTYVWGNTFSKIYSHNSDGKTSAVGLYPKGVSPFGAMDMAGNVWEWCADWYDPDYYKNAPLKNPTGPLTGTNRVLRGGSWALNVSEYFRLTYRNRCMPEGKYGDFGFRCVVAKPKH